MHGVDVGGWFATGTRSPHDARARGLPRLPDWGPDARGGYGRASSPTVLEEALAALAGAGPTTVLTGAGMSTGSGLPDYRGPAAVPRAPMTFQEFTASDLSRRRYWARATVGWTAFTRARPGRAHALLAALPTRLPLTAVITQNVDGLHQAAGSDPVIDLHGRLDRVRCLHCAAVISRDVHHDRLLAMNPEVAARLAHLAEDAARAPDGDAEVERTAGFRYPVCSLCGGMLKPDVVFFGESAERSRVEAAFAALGSGRSLLVLGSSLTVMSGLRFVRRARALGLPVVIVNDGPTRGDDAASVRVHGRLEAVLAAWLREEDARPPSRARS